MAAANAIFTASRTAISTRWPPDGPVRSAASVPCSASPTRTSVAPLHEQRLGEHEVVVDDESGGHDDEPAA